MCSHISTFLHTSLQALLCLVYEGIRSGVFSFDYGPKSTFVVQDRRAGRVYLNISQAI